MHLLYVFTWRYNFGRNKTKTQQQNRLKIFCGRVSDISWKKILKKIGFYLFGPHFGLDRSLDRLPVWESQGCSMFPLAFVAGWLQGRWWGFISRNYVVWPTFLLMNVFIALKGSHFWFLLSSIITYENWKRRVADNPKVIEFLYKYRWHDTTTGIKPGETTRYIISHLTSKE